MPVKPIAAIIRTETPANEKIFTTFWYQRPSLDFYADRQVIPADLANLGPEQYWLIHNDIFDASQDRLSTAEVLGKTETFNLVHIKKET